VLAPLLAFLFAPGWMDPPPSAGMSVYWIWFGPAQTRAGVERELGEMQASHISGSVLLSVYPVVTAGNYPYLSQQFLDVLGHSAAESRRRGLTFDVTLGTGWPYGGPWITHETAARMIRIRPAGVR